MKTRAVIFVFLGVAARAVRLKKDFLATVRPAGISDDFGSIAEVILYDIDDRFARHLLTEYMSGRFPTAPAP